MNVPKIIVKEKNNKIVCTVMCILIPVMMGILIYETIVLITKCKGDCDECHECPDTGCSEDIASEM